MMLLQAIDIHKSYRLDSTTLQILKGVNLEVERGTIVALRGRSGSGKSTLLNILGTLDRPDRGQVLLQDRDVTDLTDEELSRYRNRNIGFIFQFHHLLPELTLWENLELPLRLDDRRPPDLGFLEHLLELTGLVDRRRHFPSQLSGGERQRVAVIRALANRPGIVFADEPTGNLDAENGEIVMELIRGLKTNHGQAFLLVTHSAALAATADRTLYLNEGVVIPEAPVDATS
ncbi:MAG: ABC transporter ATP-binding protein [Candidatus Marinimicrobia bacterium]|nr:ABC transporter ATP-binding protein [Candidatus Neomarinimicrobiota bacterium]